MPEVLELAQRSIWLLIVTGALLWGLLGALGASKARLPVRSAALLAGLLPGAGLVVLALCWARHRKSAARRSTPADLYNSKFPLYSATTSGTRVLLAAHNFSSASVLDDDDVFGVPDRLSADVATSAVSPTNSQTRSPDWETMGSANLTGSRLLPAGWSGSAGGAASLISFAALVPIALLTASFVMTWVSIQPVDDLLGDFSGRSTVVTAAALLVSIVALVVAATMYVRAQQRRWSAVAALVSAPWLVLGGEVLLASRALAQLLLSIRAVHELSIDVAVIVGPGAYLLCAAGVSGLLWAIVAGSYAHAHSRRSP